MRNPKHQAIALQLEGTLQLASFLLLPLLPSLLVVMKLDMVLGVDQMQCGINAAPEKMRAFELVIERATTLEQPGQLGIQLLDLSLYMESM